MDREQRKVLDELIVWLSDEAKKPKFPRTRNLHLTDWEVLWLLGALGTLKSLLPEESCRELLPAIRSGYGSVGSPTMRDLENWRGDPYGSEREKGR